jgi:beta-galactosidase
MIHSLRAGGKPTAHAEIGALARMGEPATRDGAISLTDRYVTRNGEPWLPVMGEYHFSRDSADRWETELLKMKAGGVTVVATYVIWIVHEERRGELRWDGDRDIRRFLHLAHRHGIAVMLRIGPWAHGETRNGGFPDWVQTSGIELRTNAPEYQELVTGWYAAIAEQTHEFYRTNESPDAPIVGVQVDNELYDQPEHLGWLRTAAEEVGIVAPLWTATGWGGALLPPELMPIYAGYSDAFWEESDIVWPSFAHTHFEFSGVRDDLTVGADVRTSELVERDQDERYPWVTCELGGGMAVAYHRRPLVESADVAALALVKLGSGSAWQGYYLYHGGTHVIGEDTTTQESHATNYPNDMPRRDYDFYAPIGAHGQLREHYHLLRQQHLFIHQYGSTLLESASVIAPLEDGSPRWAFRGDTTGGHVFVNNHQPAAAPLPEITDVQFRIELDDDTVTLPSSPFTLPAGSFFAWPVRRAFGSLGSVSATVQPITELAPNPDSGAGAVVVFAAIPGVPVEFVFEGVEPAETRGGRVLTSDNATTVIAVDASPGLDCVVTVGDTTLVVLDAHSASRTWRGNIAGVETLAIWDEGLVFDEGALRLLTSRPTQTLHTFPALAKVTTDAVRDDVAQQSSVFHRYTVAGPAAVPDVQTITTVSEPVGTVPPRTGGSAGRLSAPLDGDFADAGRLDIAVPASVFDDGDTVLLSLNWTGDVGQVEIEGDTVSDQFWYGREWDIPVADGGAGASLTIRAFPFDPDSAVFVDPRVRPANGGLQLDIHQASLIRTRSVTVSP